MDLSAIQLPGYTGITYDACWTGQAWIVTGAADGRSVTPVFRSTDLANWTEIALPAGWGNNDVFSIAHDGLGRVVVVGGSGATAYSTDHGLTWTYVYAGTTDPLYDVVYALGHFIHVGASGRLRTSTDGTSWTARTSGTTSNLRGIAWDGGDRLIVTGTNVLRINTPGSVTSWPSGNTTTESRARPCYNPDNGLFYHLAGTNVLHRSTPGSNITTTTTLNQLGWSTWNTINRPLYIDNNTLLLAPHNTQQLGRVTIDGTTHTLTALLDWEGNAITGPYTGGVYENGIVLITGGNGILYTSATQQVQGTLTDSNGSPAQRTVRLYDRSTGKYLAETQSDPTTGAYAFTIGMGHPEVQRIAIHDDTAEGVIRNDLIDRVLPG